MTDSGTVRGVIVPITTPFTRGGRSVDHGALRAHAAWLAGKGVRGLMPCGTTGEGPLLSARERMRVLETVLSAAGARVQVIAHVGAATTGETLRLARHACSLGVQVLSVVTPYYFGLSEDALISHFCRVADEAGGCSVYLYNIPARAGNRVTPSVARAVVARCPNVLGIKDSSGDLATLKSFLGLDGGRFEVCCGSDALLLEALRAGAVASVSGNGNAYPELLVALMQAFGQGDQPQAQRFQKLLDGVRTLLCEGDIALIKQAVAARGLAAGFVRPPLLDAGPAVVSRLRDRLQEVTNEIAPVGLAA